MTCLARPSCAATTYLDFISYNERSMATLFGDARVYAPYVRISVAGTTQTITVGNESSDGNTASISSFQYGKGVDGVGITCEIVDQDGGIFHQFFQKIVSRFSDATDKYIIDAEWGWIRRGCYFGLPLIKTINKHRCALITVDIEHEGSIIKFILGGEDLIGGVSFEGRSEGYFGADDQPMKLKDAIRNLLSQNNPPINDVQFWRKLCDGTVQEWEFEQPEPEAVWRAEQQSVIATIQRWIRPFRTDAKLGIIPGWDDTNPSGEPRIVLWEDFGGFCDRLDQCDGSTIGSYIVNGGNCSNVLSFKTNIEWSFAAASDTGGFINPASAEDIKQQDIGDCLKEKGAGTSTYNVVPEASLRNYGNTEAGTRTAEGDKANDLATRHLGTYEPISAEMTILGDCTLDSPLLIGAFVSIVYINPFYLQQKTSGCPTWLASSNCNPVLSNKQWMINGISHQISNGTFTTTLRLFLGSPGSTLNYDLPIGDNNSGERLNVTTSSIRRGI